MRFSRRDLLHTGLAASAASLGASAVDAGNERAVPRGAQAHNVEVVGYCAMDDRPAFKMTIKQSGGRWYLYTGHFWHRGWSIVDVTDPARPEIVNFLPGPANTFTGQIDLFGDILITGLEQGLRNAPWALDPDAPFGDGVLIWSLADPRRPRRLGHFRTGGRGTHRNGYQGGRYLHLASGLAGYSGNVYQIVDIADPARPFEAGRWSVPGQRKPPGAPADAPPTPAQVAEMRAFGIDPAGASSVGHHGPAVVVGTQAWLPYGAAGVIVLDIADVRRPRMIGRLGFSPTFHAQFGIHGVLPLPARGIAVANSEDTSYGRGPAHHASLIDIRDPAQPFLLSLLPGPLPPPGAAYRSFAEKGGWSGPHNLSQLQHNPDVARQGAILPVASFNAGLRLYDIGVVRAPREVGWFLPPEPRRRYGPMPEGRLVTQSEDVLVDRRGFIYLSDKNQGVWILRHRA